MIDYENALKEAARCLNCKKPLCVEKGCPISLRIPEFILAFKNGEYQKAYNIIEEKSFLGSVCGRICPHELQCQGSCIKGIKEEPVKIGQIEAYICDWYLNNAEKNVGATCSHSQKNKKVAIIGAGPAGLTVAVNLRKKGYDVTIYEKESYLGGILIYGIPEYRLKKDLVNKMIEHILSCGIKVVTNYCIGKDMSLKGIKDKYDAVFLGMGTGVSKKLDIPGEENENIIGANEFLYELNKTQDMPFEKVLIIGGGNVAMDAARLSKHFGAKNATIIYRRNKEDMPANLDEIVQAEKENIDFRFLSKPLSIEKVNNKLYMKIAKLQKGEGKALLKTGQEFDIEADVIVVAIGSEAKREHIGNMELEPSGLVKIDENNMTRMDGVFAGGDLTNNKATVCSAIKSGIECAKSIENYLNL